MSDMPPARKTTHNTVLIVVGIFLLAILLVVGSCGLLIWFAARALGPMVSSARQMVQDLQAAQGAGQDFLSALENGDYGKAYRLADTDYQKTHSQDDLRKLVEAHPEFKKPDNSALSQAQLTPQSSTFQFTLTGSKGTLKCTVRVVKENREWKVSGFSVP